MATATEEAEKAFRSAEERFLAGDLDGALRVARSAKRHSASLPALQSALAAYQVHDAARRGRKNCWHAVLGVGVGVGHDAIKKRYKRLCLVLHPDKNRSAAADGAFKLLHRAWEVLSARHPPGTLPKPRPPPSPPPPFSSASSVNFNEWRSRYTRKSRGTAYCGHCAAGGGRHGTPGGRCHACGTLFNPPPPPQSQAEGASAPPPPAGTAAEPPPRDPPPPTT